MFNGVAGAPGVGADAVVFLGHRVLGGGAAQGGVQLAGGEVVEVEACLAVELLAGVLVRLHAGGNGARAVQHAVGVVVVHLLQGAVVGHHGAHVAAVVPHIVVVARRVAVAHAVEHALEPAAAVDVASAVVAPCQATGPI